MNRNCRLLKAALLIAIMVLTSACSQGIPADGQTGASADTKASSGKPGSPEDNIVTTKHTVVINGKELAYTAEVGTMALTTNDETCEIFYTAYTLDGVEDPSNRPVTFAFNGGPGVCSMYLHIGCLGPRRLELDEKGSAIRMPTKLVDNDNSLLDITDIVIIDAVGTGYSRAAGDSKLDDFIGYENDNRTMGDFIRLYVNRHDRWESEKYLAGESYGTVRAVGICEYLANTYSMYLNGLMLVSSANDYIGLEASDGNDLPYALYIPTFAADAWYHGFVAEKYMKMDLETYLKEVRVFVESELTSALFAGTTLTDEEKDKIAGKLSDYIGLSKKYILEKNLRISMEDFSMELLHDKKLMVGRYDGRITGPVTSGLLENGESDPSDAASELAFGSAMNHYVSKELGFHTDRPYIPIDYDIVDTWTFPIDTGSGYLSQENTIYECMSNNSYLKVWVLCGYYDGATPFYNSEWIFNHVFLNDDFKDRLSLSYYPCGHMIYMEKSAFDQFRADAEAWYSKKQGLHP